MRNPVMAFTLCICSLLVAPLTAGSKQAEVKTFTDMELYVDEINDYAHTLVVMDNDDTLTTMSCPDPSDPDTCQYLGGAAWFDWQQELIEKMEQPRVADSFDELLVVSGLLFAMNYMPYTADDVPKVLNSLVKKKVRLLVETARGKENLSATAMQFKRLPTGNKKLPTLLSLISGNSLTYGDVKQPGMVSPFLPCGGNGKWKSARTMSYQQGVMYLAGQNKGEILKCILDQYNAQKDVKKITNVVFIDDTLENVVNVTEAFANNKKYNVISLQYTALQERKKALTEGQDAKELQKNAAERWKKIKKALEKSLMNPVVP